MKVFVCNVAEDEEEIFQAPSLWDQIDPRSKLPSEYDQFNLPLSTAPDADSEEQERPSYFGAQGTDEIFESPKLW